MQPHRGVLILIFGILGVTACGILAPVAWIMGNSDLEAMRAGRMDPEGEQLTNIGRILGIIGSCLIILGIVAWIFMMVFMVAVAGAG